MLRKKEGRQELEKEEEEMRTYCPFSTLRLSVGSFTVVWLLSDEMKKRHV